MNMQQLVDTMMDVFGRMRVVIESDVLADVAR